MSALEPTPDLVADLLLRFYREPLRYRGLLRHSDHALGDRALVLKIAAGRPVELSDPALLAQDGERLREELRRAAVFYVQQMFFRADASHYDLLGLSPDASAAAVRQHFRLVMQLVHPDRKDETSWPESFATRANAAYAVLKNAGKRRDYDQQRKAPEVSMAPVRSPHWESHVVVRRAHRRSHLPEWITFRLGGWIRRQPGLAALAALTGTSIVLLLGVAGAERDARLLLGSATQTQVPAESAAEPTNGASSAHENTGTSSPKPAVVQAHPRAASHSGHFDKQVQRGRGPATEPPVGPPTKRARPSMPPAHAQKRSSSLPTLHVEGPQRRGSSGIAVIPPASTTPVHSEAPAASPPPVAANTPDRRIAEVARTEAHAAEAPALAPPAASETALALADLDTLVGSFIAAYQAGRSDLLAGVFDENAQTNLRRGRAAIRREYEELFRLSSWRTLRLDHLRWSVAGDRASGAGFMTVRIGWRDGTQAEQRIAVILDTVLRDGRPVIGRFMHDVQD